MTRSEDGRTRVIIDKVSPQIDGGRFPIKRCAGEGVLVEAHIFVDGHDLLRAVIRYRKEKDKDWSEAELESLPNDEWRGGFQVDDIGVYVYTVQAWIDRFGSWRRDLQKRVNAGQDVKVDLMLGAGLLKEAAASAPQADADRLRNWAKQLETSTNQPEAIQIALDEQVSLAMSRFAPRRYPCDFERELKVVVDPVKARFSTWYEMFPRSTAPEPGRLGTFRDCVARLP
ncbi:MAG: maltotransferase domain-containing protein, partial [Gemmataceae bacterium]